MAHWLVARIAIIGSFSCGSLEAQLPEGVPLSTDTVGIYFSSRGFQFDSLYQKAILTAPSEPLTGKAAFLLSLADSLEAHLTEAGFPARNLHRYPSYAPYIEGAESLPPGWKGLLYIQNLHLQAIPQKAVYAQSNRLRSEKYYRLECSLTILYRNSRGTKTVNYYQELPSEGWKAALIGLLRQELLLLLAED